MLIDTRDQPPEPEPERRRWRELWDDRPNLGPFLPAGKALALLIIAGYLPPVPAYVLIIAACFFILQSLGVLLSMSGDGMHDHRQ
jgi:hypothetical protein